VNLKQKIEDARRELLHKERAVKLYQKYVYDLERERAWCNHVWGDPIKNYEHEGRLCLECGVNELMISKI
jgi:hypothetical protein